MAFVGRENELNTLERLANRDSFQMVVVYGRRRIGKTALISHFCENKRALFFTAREQSSANNLQEFSQTIYRFFGIPSSAGSIGTWMDAFVFIADQAKNNPAEPFIVVFDEFPYAAETEKTLPSILQIAIDHAFVSTNITMILCGSNEGFMSSEVLGSKSPLYGRRNAQIRLTAFDYADAAKLMPGNTTWEDRINYYAVLGGTPYYLEQLDDSMTFAENITSLCFSTSGLLYEEPAMLMRQELREPALYNSLLTAIGAGQTRPKAIAERAGVEINTAGSYLKTLESLGVIERILPFGENPAKSRKGLWRFKDPFFAYWYRFVGPNIQAIESGVARGAAQLGTQGEVFATYVGQQFETICLQWLLRQCRNGSLDLTPTEFGRWWGNDPVAKEQADIDVVMHDAIQHIMLFGECKWRNTVNETEAIDRLRSRAQLICGNNECRYYLFTKYPASEATQAKTNADPSLTLVDAASMMNGD